MRQTYNYVAPKVPRKSILKAYVNVDPSSQQSSSSSQAPNGDDANATRSMDITQDYSAPAHDNNPRKSIGGRRVGFSRESHVRLFDPRRRSSTQSPRSSLPTSAAPPAQSNENDYPGQKAQRRRSSLRYSMAGSEDMDMTTVMEPGAFQARGSAILDEEFDFDDEDEEYGNDDMEVTEVIHGELARKRSLSMGGRQPQESPSVDQSFEGDESRSDIGNQSTQSFASDSASERSHIMEFTIPLGQSLRPAQKDDVWLALKQMTHSGGEASEPEESFEEDSSQHEEREMDLDDAMDRLRRARDSLPLSESQEIQDNGPHEDSFTNTEDSFNDDNEDELDGNKTLNLSRVLGRPSIGLNSRMSMGYGSNMDESEIYGNIVATQSTPRQSLAPQSQPPQPQEAPVPAPQPQQPRKSLVFQPPPADVVPQPAAPVGQPRKSTGAFTPRASSPSKSNPETPSKAKPKPTFSAAFAPPVTRPSPKKPAPVPSASATTPAKRPRSSTQDGVEDMEIDQPSPAKRQALASKWLDAAEAPKQKSPSLSPIADKTAPIASPRPLSPAKKAPFLQSSVTGNASSELSGARSALRRPSGYFAKRKSMAVSFNVPIQEPAPSVARSSTKKKPGIGMGRASMGSAPVNPWKRVEKPTEPTTSDKVSRAQETNEQLEVENNVQATAPEESASRNPTRNSPTPNRALLEEPRHLEHVEPSPQTEQIPDVDDVAEMPDPEAELSGRMDVDTDATQQWREGVEQAEYEEEEEVVNINI